MNFLKNFLIIIYTVHNPAKTLSFIKRKGPVKCIPPVSGGGDAHGVGVHAAVGLPGRFLGMTFGKRKSLTAALLPVFA